MDAFDPDNDPLYAWYLTAVPCDETLLVPLGKIVWATARLHAGIRDRLLFHYLIGPDDKEPYSHALGGAVKEIRAKAVKVDDHEMVDWADAIGFPAVTERNKVMHATVYTAADDENAICDWRRGADGRLQAVELELILAQIVHATHVLPIRERRDLDPAAVPSQP